MVADVLAALRPSLSKPGAVLRTNNCFVNANDFANALGALAGMGVVRDSDLELAVPVNADPAVLTSAFQNATFRGCISCCGVSTIVAAAVLTGLARQKFSNVSLLRNVRCELMTALTFENFCQCRMHCDAPRYACAHRREACAGRTGGARCSAVLFRGEYISQEAGSVRQLHVADFETLYGAMGQLCQCCAHQGSRLW